MAAVSLIPGARQKNNPCPTLSFPLLISLPLSMHWRQLFDSLFHKASSLDTRVNRQGSHIDLEMLRSRDKWDAARGTFLMTLSPRAHTRCWGRGRCFPLSHGGQEITPGASHFSRKSENSSNVRTWPSDSRGLCYGNAEQCPPGPVAPGTSPGGHAPPLLSRHLLGGCRRLKPKPRLVRNNEPLFRKRGNKGRQEKGQFNIQEWK